MIIPFSLSYVFHPGASQVDNAYALKTLLECLILLNQNFLRAHPALPLYQSGVRYGRTVNWDSIPDLYAKGYGDCKSLTAALVAEYRMKHIEAKPVFRWVRGADGVSDYHILVQTAAGFEDPSRVLGMGKDENAYFQRRG